MKREKLFLTILIGFIALLTIGLIVAFPSIKLYLFDECRTYEGINNYSYGLSSMELCNYLDFRDHQKKGSGDFVEEHPYSSAYFRYEIEQKGGYDHEKVLLSLAYDKTTYQEAMEDIISKPGFSEKIRFLYGDFVFYLNETERLALRLYLP